MEPPKVDPYEDLITTWSDLSAPIDELTSEPSPLEFMRYVARNTPFVVRGFAKSWPAFKTFDSSFLVREMRGRVVNVAVTPFGNADSPTEMDDGSGEVVFAKPLEEEQLFEDVIGYVMRQENEKDFPADAEVRYCQTQNDNLGNEYAPLTAHLPSTIPFSRIALSREPDATNLWLGNGRSTSALHRDPYENIYVQLRGRKHFVLLPPLCAPCVREKFLRPATYVRHPVAGEQTMTSGNNGLKLVLDDGDEGEAERVPFATWDPDVPCSNTTKYSALVTPVRVTLFPGDMLYLPTMWYHKVSQSCSPEDEGFVLAVNYWYDMDYSSPLYPLCNFVRNTYLEQSKADQERISGST